MSTNVPLRVLQHMRLASSPRTLVMILCRTPLPIVSKLSSYTSEWAADFATVKKAVDTGSATIVDVRNPGELKEEGKIPKAINVPLPEMKEALALSEEEFTKKYGCARPGERDPLILHCKAGGRAAKAASLMTEGGFINLRVYTGSFGDWVSQGGPVEGGPVEK